MFVPLLHSAVDYVVEVFLLAEGLPQFFPGFELSFNAASRLKRISTVRDLFFVLKPNPPWAVSKSSLISLYFVPVVLS